MGVAIFPPTSLRKPNHYLDLIQKGAPGQYVIDHLKV